MSTTKVFVALAVLALAAVADAQKGKTLRGYTFSTDAGLPYLKISQDIMDIRKALNQKNPDYAAAKAIYMDGKNAVGADGQLISLRSLGTRANKNTPFWKKYDDYFGTPFFVDELLMRAFGGLAPFNEDAPRVQAIVKGLESSLQFAVVMNLLDEAAAETKAGKKADAEAALDKAWALFVGGAPDAGLWTVTMKRANEYGTKVTCDISVAAKAVQDAFLAAQKAVKAGDAAGVAAAAKAVQDALSATFAQAIITYAHEMYLDKAANISASEHQVEAYSFFRTIAPLIHAANSNASEALDFWLFPANPVEPDVDLKAARALSSAYKGLGINKDVVGRYGKKQPELNCKAYVPEPTPGGILATTDAKDSLRPAEGAAPAAAAPAAAAKPAGRRLRAFHLW